VFIAEVADYKTQIKNIDGQLKSARKKLKGKIAVHGVKSKSLKSLLGTI